MAKPNPKILVVFFSRTGTTRRVAEAIARACGADLEQLREARSRSGLFGWLRSGFEATRHRTSETLPLEHELSRYDLVFVGTPTWSRALASPVRGFLEQKRAQLPRVALFATHGRDGPGEALEQMGALLARPPLAQLSIRDRDVLHGAAVWVGELVEAALSAWQSEAAAAQRASPDTVSG